MGRKKKTLSYRGQQRINSTIVAFDVRKNVLLIRLGVEIAWDNQRNNGSWDAYQASPADFAGANDIITNLAKERESLGSRSLIFDYY